MSVQYNSKFLKQWANRYGSDSPFSEQATILLHFSCIIFLCAFFFDQAIFMFVLSILPILILGFSHLMRFELEIALESLEMSFKYDPQVYRDQSATLVILLTNPSNFDLNNIELSLRFPDGFSSTYLCTVSSESQLEIKAELHHLHLKAGIIWGAKIKVCDSLGLAQGERYFIKECQSSVLPKFLAAHNDYSQQNPSSMHYLEQHQNSVFKKHLEGEFKELRQYQAFDTPNRIAWKASARRGKLLTKVYENSSEPRHLIAIDVHSFMQSALPLGETRLALALDYVQQILQQLSNQNIALCVYDHRLLADLPLAPQALTRQRWQQLESYFAQALMHDCVLETQDEFWDMLSEYLVWIGAEYQAEQAGLQQEPHFKPSLRLLNSMNKSFMAQWLADRKDLDKIPYLQEIGLDDIDRRLRLFCYQKGIFGTPYIARPLHAQSQGLKQVMQKARAEKINHLIILSHSHRLQSTADHEIINSYLKHQRSLTWVQIASLHQQRPHQLSAFINRINYIPIHFNSDKLDPKSNPMIKWHPS